MTAPPPLRPRLDILPAAQRRLWLELSAVPPAFVLYGGTAIALRLGHRVSVDFDFFAHDPLDRKALQAVPFLSSAEVLQEERDTLTVLIDRGDPVKVSFFGGIAFGRVGAPDKTEDSVLRVASLLDLAATKLKVLLQRVEAKDYLDVDALLGAGLGLPQCLAAARTVFALIGLSAVVLAGLPFEAEVLSRASAFTYAPGATFPTWCACVKSRSGTTTGCG